MNWATTILIVIVGAFGIHAYRQRTATPSTWAEAVLVTNPTRIAQLDGMYVDLVARIQAVRPEAVQTPIRRVAYRVHPRSFPSPSQNGWGKTLAPAVLDPHGTIVVLQSMQNNDDLWQHEMVHAITGIPDHPQWLFGAGLTLTIR